MTDDEKAAVHELKAERDRLRHELDHSPTHKALQAMAAENARLRAEVGALLAAGDADALLFTQLSREHGRLLAVLKETPRNVGIVVDAMFGASLIPQDMEIQERIYAGWRRGAAQALAALREEAKVR